MAGQRRIKWLPTRINTLFCILTDCPSVRCRANSPCSGHSRPSTTETVFYPPRHAFCRPQRRFTGCRLQLHLKIKVPVTIFIRVFSAFLPPCGAVFRPDCGSARGMFRGRRSAAHCLRRPSCRNNFRSPSAHSCLAMPAASDTEIRKRTCKFYRFFFCSPKGAEFGLN